MTFGELMDCLGYLESAGVRREQRLVVKVRHADDSFGCAVAMRRGTIGATKEAVIFLDVELDAIEQHRPPE